MKPNDRRNRMNFGFFLPAIAVALLVISPVMAADDANQTSNAYYWYNKAVDLANEGKFSEALQANEQALAIDESMPLALANKAGILVQLGRYNDAITNADKLLSTQRTDMPNAYAAAYYSKGDALQHLGRIEEAKAAYAKAYELDKTLVPPDMISVTPSKPPARSPLPWFIAPMALALVLLICTLFPLAKK